MGIVVKARVRNTRPGEPEHPSGTHVVRRRTAELPVSSPAADRRLENVLRALPEQELLSLAKRVGLRLDPRKRIDPPAQVARALVRLPELKDPSRVPAASLGLLHRIAEAGGLLTVGSVPPGLEQLAFRGLVFARGVSSGVELILPTAFLVQLKPWDAEDSRSLRALLADASFENASAVASHYLGRTATPPIALMLESAWEALSEPSSLEGIVESVSFEERRLLEALVRLGGEVDSEELMDLERRPMRLSGAGSLATGRRGAAFFLEKRGLLFSVPPARFVVPQEVVALVDGERQRKQRERRAGIRSQVVAQDLLPRRARFSPSPAGFAVAMAIVARESRSEIKPEVGTPRSLLTRIAQRFGKDAEVTALVATLSRVVGLWDPAGPGALAPPWTLRLDELDRAMFEAWRRGAAWDEARPVPETLRLPPDQRDPSPVRAVRELVLDGLRELGSSRWIPLQSLLAYVRHDPRTDGLERLLTRWAARASISSPSVVGLAARIATESLPALGVLDVGDLDASDCADGSAVDSPAVRVTSRGRAWLALEAEGDGGEPARASDDAGFDDAGGLRCGPGTLVSHVVAIACCAELRAVEPELELAVDAATLARGLAMGLDAQEVRLRLEALGPIPGDLLRELARLSAVVGRGTMVGCSAFLWVDDPEVREMLRVRPSCADLFLDPSPPAGLLVSPGVDPERLVRRCRAVGVDVEVDGQLLRARRPTRPGTNPRQSAARASSHPRQAAARPVTWRPPSRSGRGTE